MNKYYDEFKQMIDAYLAKHGKQVEFESNLYETSLNDADSKNIYDNTRKDIDVISMDDIAHKPYREIRYPESVKEEDSISTNDAFVISEENEWYFIEFKDQTLNKTKDSVSKKAYSNWHMLLDIIYEMKSTCHLSGFDYEDPIQFARNHVTFILVISEKKNPNDAFRIQKGIDYKCDKNEYVPLFLQKLQKYIYHDVFVYTPAMLERYFVNMLRF